MALKNVPQSKHVNWKDIIDRFNSVRMELFGGLGKRDLYLWKWVYNTSAKTKLVYSRKESTNPDLEELATSTKTLGVMWDVLADDVADELEISQAKKILPDLLYENGKVGKQLTKDEEGYVEFTHSVKRRVFDLAKKLPGYKRHKNSLVHEYDNLCETMKYALEIRIDPAQIDLKKYINILSNNMHVVINGVIDIMKLDYPETIEEDQNLRMLLWYAQRMGRIGNSVTTYERELAVNDLSSEIIAVALSFGYIDRNALQDASKILKTIHEIKLEETMWALWKNYKHRIESMVRDLPLLDVNSFLKGLIIGRKLHEHSRGKK